MTAAPASPAQFLASGKTADTYDWDTAYAINFNNANAAVTAAWPSVNQGAKSMVVAASDDPSYHIDATLGPWLLTEGGDGKNVRLQVPLLSGKYYTGANSIPFDGANCSVVIELGMQWVPDPNQFSFVIGDATVPAITTALNQNQISSDLTAAFSAHQKPLSGNASALVQTAGEEWLITDGSTNFYIFHSTDKYNNAFLNIYQFEKAWANNLKALAQAASDDEPAVTIITIKNNPTKQGSIAADVLPSLLSDWFNSNISQFDHVFSSLDLSPLISTGDKFAWLKPTATSYAVTDEGTLDSSVFGVMTMALNDAPSANHQVSPNAIPSGADAGYLISGPMFLQNMILPGAQIIFNNAPASSFTVDSDGLEVRNTADLVWGKFMLDNKKEGSIAASPYSGQLDNSQISDDLVMALQDIEVFVGTDWTVAVQSKGSQWLLSQGQDEYILNLDGSNIDVFEATVVSVAKGQFTMTLFPTYVEIKFTDLKYSYSSDFDVHVNYTEQVQLTLKKQGDKQVFWFDQVLKNLVVSVTKTQSAITREIVEGAVMAALSLIAIAGPIIEGLSAGAEIGEVTEEGGEAVIDAETFSEVEDDFPDDAEQDNEDTGDNAATTSGGKLSNIKAAFGTPKWKFVATMAALAGAVTGADTAIDAIIENAAQNQWQNVPGFDDFATFVIQPYSWPNVKGWSLASTTLNGSLQIGLKVSA
jgi:hypothetical protein